MALCWYPPQLGHVFLVPLTPTIWVPSSTPNETTSRGELRSREEAQLESILRRAAGDRSWPHLREPPVATGQAVWPRHEAQEPRGK